MKYLFTFLSVILTLGLFAQDSPYCGTAVTHFGIAAEEASKVKLTIKNVDATSMIVEMESADADPVDDLIVNNLTGPITGSPAVSDLTDDGNGKLSRTLTWTGTAPTDVELCALWSKESFGGNWQLSQTNVTVPFTATCSTSGNTENNITFRVDMNDYSGTIGTGVYVNGTYNDWCGDCNPMTDADGDGVWEVTLPLPVDVTEIEYKYTVDGWTDQEMLTDGSSCTRTTGANINRVLAIDGDEDLATVCWNSCDACGTTSSMSDITFKVNMTNYQGPTEALGVFVNGTFNGWCGACNPLADDDGDGIWETTISLPDMDTIEYKFTLGGWTDQEELMDGMPCTKSTDDGQGNLFVNRYLEINGSEELPAYCFNSCATDDCPIVEGVTESFVTFRVDMNEYGGSTADGVFVNGTFNGWCGTCNPMADDDGDGIWDLTIPLTGVDEMEYKFTVGGWNDQESLTDGSACTKTTIDGDNTFVNRYLQLDGSIALPAVCWNSCEGCATSPLNNVTFKVDMNSYTAIDLDTTTVNLNGSFNGWCGSCIEMYDNDGDGIYEVVVPVPDTIEYKFTVGGWTDDETLTPGLPCTKTSGNFTNRYLEPMGDTVLDAVCWESCDACGQSSSSEVTFKVDMNKYGSSFDFVNVSGVFNGWCGDCAQMTDDDGDGIYELTASILKGEIEWKYTVNNWSDQELFTDGDACTKTTVDGGDTFVNRYMELTEDITGMDAVCWNACVTCNLVSTDEFFAQTNTAVFPNPTNNILNVISEDRIAEFVNSIALINTVGQRMVHLSVNDHYLNEQIDVTGLNSGVYFLQVNTETASYHQMVIVE